KYTVTASTGQTAIGTSSPITLAGLTNGVTVTVTVTATNQAGTSAPSAASNAVTPAAPTSAWSGPPAYVKALGSNALTASGTTLTVTTTGAAALSNAVILGIVANGAETPTVTDSAGNTYQVDAYASNGTATTTYLASTINIYPMASGSTITVTFPTARTLVTAKAHEIGGLKDVNVDPGDGVSTGTGNAATALATGPIGTTLGRDFLFTVFGMASNGTTLTFTPGSGWTDAGTNQAAAGGSSRDMYAEYQVVTNPSSVAATATVSSAKNYSGVTFAYSAIDPGTPTGAAAVPAYGGSIGEAIVTTSNTTAVLTTTAAVTAGRSIIVIADANGAVSATCTDSASNTYNLDGQVANGSAVTTYIFSAHNVTALASGQTITLTFASARNQIGVQAHQVAGIKGARDGSTTGVANNSTALSTGAISTTSDNDFLVAAWSMAGNNTALTFTPGTGMTALGYTQAGSSSSSRELFAEYRLVASPSSAQAKATVSTAKNSAGVAIAYLASGSSSAGASQTGTYSTLETLGNALLSALPGDVLTLASSTTFAGNLAISGVHGTAANPITVTGATSAIVDNGGNNNSVSAGYGVGIDNCSYLIVSGFTVQYHLKGVMVERCKFVTIDGLTVTHIGEEGIHLRNETTDSTIQNCIISHTGEQNANYGESMYCGTAESNWTASTRKPAAASGYPDLCHRNKFLNNTCSTGTAECMDIKEGTVGGLVQGNTFDGTLIQGANFADSWTDTKGSGWTIKGNTGTTIMTDGHQTHYVTSGNISPSSKFVTGPYVNWDGTTQPAVTSGQNNVFDGNTCHCSPATGYGFMIAANSPANHGNKVYTNNVVDGAASGASNIPETAAP
ncbi:hypothetical protein, partial [Frankia sp. Cj3]|uniref:beta strand repeat-containing protein n=1 Tax=Frankia sp. Cj3 TaxID=2880976 RepID=UPI001EF494EA